MIFEELLAAKLGRPLSRDDWFYYAAQRFSGDVAAWELLLRSGSHAVLAQVQAGLTHVLAQKPIGGEEVALFSAARDSLETLLARYRLRNDNQPDD